MAAVSVLLVGCNRKSENELRAECQANLRKIEEAKNQLIIEKKIDITGTFPTWPNDPKEVLDYARLKSLDCPAGGKYTIGHWKERPHCSIALHNER